MEAKENKIMNQIDIKKLEELHIRFMKIILRKKIQVQLE